MSTQLLIYETAIAVSPNRHSDCYVESGGYGFSRHVNSVPLMAVEFVPAASEYAIIFAGADGEVMPAVILGMRGKENAYINTANEWHAKYIPAFIRRYPFVFSSSNDGQTFTLCIDEAYAGFNRDKRGQALFGEDQKPTPYVENVLTFLQEYQSQFQRTQAFCKKLQELDLLEPMQATMSLETGERLSLTGFMAVNRDKLKALSGEVLSELAKTDELELIYLHLHSMRNLSNMKDRMTIVPSEGDASEKDAPLEKQEKEVKAKKAEAGG